MAKIVPLLKAIVRELRQRFFSSACSFCKIVGYSLWKCKLCRLYIQNPAFRLLQIGHKLENNNGITTCWHDVIINFFWRCFVSMSSLVTGPSFMLMSSLVLELWQHSFIRDWLKIWKLEIPPSESCPISWDWGELEIPNLAQMSLMKCYWMLQNTKVRAFTISLFLILLYLSKMEKIL